MSDFGRDRSDSASKDQREANTGGAATQEAPSMLGSAVSALGKGVIQRKLADRAAKRAEPTAGGGSGGGAPLPTDVREKMEGSFGADFSDVRVHQGGTAAALGANAYARGNELHFAPGQYDPSSQGGQALIGHELTHVVQQRSGRVAAVQGKGASINNDSSLEGEADQAGAAAARGEPVQVSGSSAGLQKKATADAPIQLDKTGNAAAAVQQGAVPAQQQPAAAPAAAQAPEQQRVKGGFSLISGIRARQAGQAALKDPAPTADARAIGIVDAMVKSQFSATANWLSGTAWNTDKPFRHAFLTAWRNVQPSFDPAIDDNSDPAFLDRIIDAQFKGSPLKQGYLKELREYGDSGPVWKVRMAMGKIEGGSANDDAVVREIEAAPEKLGKFKIANFKAYWDQIKDDVKDKLHHWRDAADMKYRRVLAFVRVQAGNELVESIEKELGKAEAAVTAKKAEKLDVETHEVAPAKALAADATRREEDAHKAHTKEEANVHTHEASVSVADGNLTKQSAVAKAATQAAATTKTQELKDALEAKNLAQKAGQAAELAFTRALKLSNLQAKKSELTAAQAKPAVEAAAQAQAKEKEKAPAEPAPPSAELVEIEQLIAVAKRQSDEAELQAKQARLKADAADAKHMKSTAAAQAAKADATTQTQSEAAMRAELAKQKEDLEAARVQCENAEKAVKQAKEQAEAAEKALKEVEKKVKGIEDELVRAEVHADVEKMAKASAEDLRAPDAVNLLGALVREQAGNLNKFEHEAIEKIEKWCEKYGPAARTLALKDPSDFLVALKLIKKPRDQQFLKDLVEGKRSTADAAKLHGDHAAGKPGLGYGKEEVEAHESEVTKAALVVDREVQKGKDKKHPITIGPAKVQHTILKEHLLGLSPAGRDQYLSLVSGLDKTALADEAQRDGAIAILDKKLKDECKITDATERQKILAVFRIAGAGANYAKLHALVATTAPSKWSSDEDFGKKALKYTVALQDGEYAQVRQDHTLLDALAVCTTKEPIGKLLGVSTRLNPKGDLKANAETAKADAEHSTKHWATELDLELEKWRVSLREQRSSNKMYLIGHAAQQAANSYSKAKNPADLTAGQADHADAKTFMADVWKDVKHQGDMQSHYAPLAAAFKAGGPVTLDMALNVVTSVNVGVGHIHNVHVDKNDFKKTLDQCKGRELAVEWSNVKDCKDAIDKLSTRQEKDTFKRGFVLDVQAKRQEQIKGAIGDEEGAKTIAELRTRFAESAAHDDAFKAELENAGYDNTKFNRRQMELRSVHETGEKAGKGAQFSLLSAKGKTAEQDRRQLSGEERRAHAKDEELVSTKTGDKVGDAGIDKARDKDFSENHAKEIDERAENVELSVEEFQKLRDHIKEACEVVIGIIIAVAIGAATMGVGTGVAIAAKIAAVVLTQLAKQAIGALIMGDPFNWRSFVIGTVAESAGAACGVGAGLLSANVDNPFAKAVAKAVLSNTAKSFAKDSIKGITQRTKGEVGLASVATNWSVAMLASVPTAVITTAVEEGMHKSDIESDKKTHEKSLDSAKDKATDAHGEAAAKPGELSAAQSEAASAHADAALAGMRLDADQLGASHVSADHALVTLDNQHVQHANQDVFTARHQLEQARIKLRFDIAHHNTGSVAQDKATLASAHEHLTATRASLVQAKTQLSLDKATLAADQAKAADLPEAHSAYDEAIAKANEQDAKVTEAIGQVDEAIKKAQEADEAVEAAKGLVEADEARLAPIEQVANFLDFTIEKTLDPLWEKGIDHLAERYSLQEKIERVKPEPKEGEEEEAHAAAPAHGAPAHGGPAHGAVPAPVAAPGHHP